MKKYPKSSQKQVCFHRKMFDYRKGSIKLPNGNEVFMEHRLKESFSILLDKQNDVVTRDELMSFVWKEIVVSEESITKAISDLRKFLGKHGINNINIITIRKLGYMLEILPVQSIKNSGKRSLALTLKILLYLVLLGLFLIILIRALRYEQ